MKDTLRNMLYNGFVFQILGFGISMGIDLFAPRIDCPPCIDPHSMTYSCTIYFNRFEISLLTPIARED